MPIKSRNNKKQLIRSRKALKYGGRPPAVSLENVLRNIKCCVVHNLNNTILITNYGLNRVEILDMNRQHLGSFGEGILHHPRCINVDQQNGNIIVTDRNNLVSIFDRNGNFIRRINGFRGLLFQFAPKEIAIASNGNILITDIENDRICCVDRMGVELFELTQYPNSNDLNDDFYFANPYGLCVGMVDGEERIIVGDSHNSHIVIFDLNGQYINTIFQDGDSLDGSDYIDEATIVNFALDDNSNLVCLDFQRHNRLIIIDATSGYHRVINLNLDMQITPRMIRIDRATGNIYLTDETQNLVAVLDRNYQFLHIIPNVEIDFKIIRKRADIPPGIEEDDQCGACLELLLERSSMDVNHAKNNVNGFVVQLHENAQSQAPHIFHFKCIKLWLSADGRPKICPTCRAPCKHYSKLVNTNIPEGNDGVDFFEPLVAVASSAEVGARAEEKELSFCNQFNGRVEECLKHKPKCLWAFKDRKCIDNLNQNAGMKKSISKQNKNNRYRRSIKK